MTQLTDGMRLSFRAGAANTGAAKFSPNGLAAKPVYAQGHAALLGGEIVVNGFIEVEWNSNMNGWVLCENSGGLMPQGIINRGVQQFTSSGSFTVSAGVTNIYVSGCAGGGGGGGTSATGASQNCSGGGGGGAGQAILRQGYSVTPGQVISVTVGSGGSGGVGGSPFDASTPASRNATGSPIAGINAAGYGSGRSGGGGVNGSVGSTPGTTGDNGTSGIVIIEW